MRTAGARARRGQTGERLFRNAIRERSGGWCEAGTPACPPHRHEGHHSHHVAPSDRARGVHDPARGLYVCAVGHQWIHDHPADAETAGWLRRSEAP